MYKNDAKCLNSNTAFTGLERNECNKQYSKQRYQENKHDINEHHKQYCEENKDKIKEPCKQYYQENKQKINTTRQAIRKTGVKHILQKIQPSV